jgi:signal transduction histidine kinase
VRHAASRVELTLTERDAVELLIDDDGPGIPGDDRQRVFERFVRLDEARTKGDGGTGLGLAIAHDILVAHGGTITIADAPIGGARVVMTLPAVAQSKPNAARLFETDTAQAPL